MTGSTRTTRFTLTGVAALVLAFATSAPAMAGCRSVMATKFDADDSDVDVSAGDGAYWGAYGRGYGHQLYGTVAGCSTRAVTGSLDYGTRTRLDVRGFDNRVGTQARSGGRVDVFSRGDGNEFAVRVARGSYVGVRNHGSGNRYRAEAW